MSVLCILLDTSNQITVLEGLTHGNDISLICHYGLLHIYIFVCTYASLHCFVK